MATELHIALDEDFLPIGESWSEEGNPIHPYLVRASFVAVNRRIKKPVHTAAKTLSEQPLYMVLKRDGSFLCGACTLDGGWLLVNSYPNRPAVPQQLRNGIDAEVIGQVTAVVRRFDEVLGSAEAVTPDSKNFGPEFLDRPSESDFLWTTAST